MKRLASFALFDNNDLPAQATLDGLAVGSANSFIRYMCVAGEESVVGLSTRFQNFGAYRVDANAARHVDGGTNDETVQGAIGCRCACTAVWRLYAVSWPLHS